jgi:hypothetical protein
MPQPQGTARFRRAGAFADLPAVTRYIWISKNAEVNVYTRHANPRGAWFGFGGEQCRRLPPSSPSYSPLTKLSLMQGPELMGISIGNHKLTCRRREHDQLEPSLMHLHSNDDFTAPTTESPGKKYVKPGVCFLHRQENGDLPIFPS